MIKWAFSVVDLIGSWFGWQRERENRLNAPEIRANAEAGRDAKLKDQATEAVMKASKTGELDEIRKMAGD